LKVIYNWYFFGAFPSRCKVFSLSIVTSLTILPYLCCKALLRTGASRHEPVFLFMSSYYTGLVNAEAGFEKRVSRKYKAAVNINCTKYHRYIELMLQSLPQRACWRESVLVTIFNSYVPVVERAGFSLKKVATC